jgi:hypothetical protein
MRSERPPHVEPEVPPAVQVAQKGWPRLRDGAHPWGSFDAMIGRYGVRRYRLIIYPPGIGAADRRAVRLWRGWPLGGAVLGLLAVMLLGNAVLSPRTLLLGAVTIYVVVGAALFVRAGTARTRLRSMSIVLVAGCIYPYERRMYTEWETVVSMLTRADRLLATSAISPVEHEAVWWEAYDRLEMAARV